MNKKIILIISLIFLYSCAPNLRALSPDEQQEVFREKIFHRGEYKLNIEGVPASEAESYIVSQIEKFQEGQEFFGENIMEISREGNLIIVSLSLSESFLFKKNSDIPKLVAYQYLDYIAGVLNQYNQSMIMVSGSGNPISQKRAVVVERILGERGLNPSRILTAYLRSAVKVANQEKSLSLMIFPAIKNN